MKFHYHALQAVVAMAAVSPSSWSMAAAANNDAPLVQGDGLSSADNMDLRNNPGKRSDRSRRRRAARAKETNRKLQEETTLEQLTNQVHDLLEANNQMQEKLVRLKGSDSVELREALRLQNIDLADMISKLDSQFVTPRLIATIKNLGSGNKGDFKVRYTNDANKGEEKTFEHLEQAYNFLLVQGYAFMTEEMDAFWPAFVVPESPGSFVLWKAVEDSASDDLSSADSYYYFERDDDDGDDPYESFQRMQEAQEYSGTEQGLSNDNKELVDACFVKLDLLKKQANISTAVGTISYNGNSFRVMGEQIDVYFKHKVDAFNHLSEKGYVFIEEKDKNWRQIMDDANFGKNVRSVMTTQPKLKLPKGSKKSKAYIGNPHLKKHLEILEMD